MSRSIDRKRRRLFTKRILFLTSFEQDPRSHRRTVETGAIGGRAPGHSQDVEHLGQLSEEGGEDHEIEKGFGRGLENPS